MDTNDIPRFTCDRVTALNAALDAIELQLPDSQPELLVSLAGIPHRITRVPFGGLHVDLA